MGIIDKTLFSLFPKGHPWQFPKSEVYTGTEGDAILGDAVDDAILGDAVDDAILGDPNYSIFDTNELEV